MPGFVENIVDSLVGEEVAITDGEGYLIETEENAVLNLLGLHKAAVFISNVI